MRKHSAYKLPEEVRDKGVCLHRVQKGVKSKKAIFVVQRDVNQICSKFSFLEFNAFDRSKWENFMDLCCPKMERNEQIA